MYANDRTMYGVFGPKYALSTVPKSLLCESVGRFCQDFGADRSTLILSKMAVREGRIGHC